MKKNSNQKLNKWLIIFGVLMGMGLFGNLLQDAEKKKIRKAFEKARPELVSKLERAIETKDFSNLGDIENRYKEIADADFLALIEDTKDARQKDTDVRLGRICAFKIHKVDNHDYGHIRIRRTWHVTINGAETPVDLGATVIHAARALQKQSEAHTATVIASVTKEGILEELAQNLAVAHYIPDGKGFSGDGDSKVWDVDLPFEVPSEEAIEAHQISAKMRKPLRAKFPGEFIRQDQEINRTISTEMGISVEDAAKFFILFSPQPKKGYVYKGEQLSFISKEAKASVNAELKK